VSEADAEATAAEYAHLAPDLPALREAVGDMTSRTTVVLERLDDEG
jgi:hypothetical protein